MKIDALTFRAIAGRVFPRGETLSADEARAIVQLCFLVTRADLEETLEERPLRLQLGRHVCALAGISLDSVAPPSPLPLPIDDEARHDLLADLASHLTTAAARELAYVLAYLLVVSDVALARIEAVMLAELQEILGIADTRASELVADAVELATPMAGASARG